MSLDFQPYLESICATYAKWWQLYTLTDAAGKQRQVREAAPMFDFGLMVETVGQEGREAAREVREKEKIERLPVLAGIRKYVDPDQVSPHVLLVGRPGSGKSTALARLLLEEAEAALPPSPSPKTGRGEPEVRRIPVLVELRYWQGSISQLILNALARHGLPLPPEQLETVLARSLILFDGVNELPSEEARSQLMAFRRDHPKVPMIFTTRDLGLGGDLGIEQKLEMQPLTEAQMQAFVRAYVPEQAEALLRQLKDRLRELGQTPLLLWMLCGLFQQTGTIPENLGLVFRLFTQGYERNLKQDVVIESDRAWWQPVLQQLAWVMMQGAQPTELRVAIAKKEAVGAIAQFLTGKVPYAEDFARKCLRDLQKHHLIQAGTNPDELEFRHQLLQEYYAAEALLERLERLPGLSDAELQREYLNYLKWTEPVALMLALVGDEGQAVRVVRVSLAVDLRLGARLAGKVKREFQGRTVDLIQQRHTAGQLPVWLLVQLFDQSCSEAAIPGLLNALEDSNKDVRVRRRAAETLGEIGSAAAIPGLLKALEHSNSGLHWSAANALGKIGSESSISGLLKALADSNKDVSLSVVSVLGEIGSEAAIPGLLKTLADSNSDVSMHAAYALGKIGSESSVPGLLKMLADSDSDKDMRRNATSALGKIGSDAAIPGLLKTLADSDKYVRRSAASALGEIGSEAAISGLLKVLADSDKDVRGNAAYALGEIGSESSIPGLLKTLADSDEYVRRNAASALGNIGSDAVIPGLLKMLADSDWMVRANAADALGKIGSEASIPGLLKALEHSNYYVRGSAVSVLGNIGSDAAIPGLLQALEDSAWDVRRRAADALGKIGSEAAIPGLLKALEDSNKDVRESATKALGQIGTDAAIPNLLQALEDSAWEVRVRAADALGNIGSDAVIPGLLRAIVDSAREVRESATKALGQIGTDAAIPNLLQALEDSDWDVHKSAASALGNIGSDAAILGLLKAMATSNIYVCRITAVALGNIGSDAAISGLLKVLEYSDWELRENAVKALGQIGSAAAIPGLLKAMEDYSWGIRTIAIEALGKLKDDLAAPLLPSLLPLLPTPSSEHAFNAIQAIQANCQFYNYTLFHSPPAPPPPSPQDTLAKIEQTVDTLAKTMSDQPTISITGGTFNAPVNLAPNQGHQPTTIIGTQHNYFGADDTLLQQITELQQFITELETQHPHIQTLPEAEAARDQAITKIQATNPTRWQTIRHQMRLLKRQLLNPDRHLQATKATLVEVTKAYWEQSLIAKAIVTYIDKLSETPDQGA